MQGLNVETKTVISDLAQRYSLSENAVGAMLVAVRRGHGTMAQFDIGELGGNGQWMLGGMTMVGDMFNHGLKNTVDGLCRDLSQALSSGRIDLPGEGTCPSSWWPQWLGVPSSTGGQNDSAYAVFPPQRCLAIKDGSGISLYDTQDHVITGVGQQQGSRHSQTFTSQRGSFSVSDLRRIDEAAGGSSPHGAERLDSRTPSAGPAAAAAPEPSPSPLSVDQRLVDAAETTSPASAPPATVSDAPATPPTPGDGQQLVALIEKLGALRDAGILTEAEFAAKKAELLARL